MSSPGYGPAYAWLLGRVLEAVLEVGVLLLTVGGCTVGLVRLGAEVAL